MNVDGHESRVEGHNPIRNAVEEAQSVLNGGDFFGTSFSPVNILMFGAIVAFMAIVSAAYYYGVPTHLVFTQRMATENALTYYSTVAGIAGFVGSIIASNRLASVDADTVTVRQMAAPMLVTAGGNAVAGFLFPSG